ncbi:MAG TPA: Rho termination factor [Sphingobacterium sp.]|nr:Rho termination factor [Sphingobacterium sp.]
MAKDHGKQIKDDAKYEALRRQGASKEKAARIANTPDAGKKGGQSAKLEERTKAELLEQAKEIGIKGRHTMDKSSLIRAIREH